MGTKCRVKCKEGFEFTEDIEIMEYSWSKYVQLNGEWVYEMECYPASYLLVPVIYTWDAMHDNWNYNRECGNSCKYYPQCRPV